MGSTTMWGDDDFAWWDRPGNDHRDCFVGAIRRGGVLQRILPGGALTFIGRRTGGGGELSRLRRRARVAQHDDTGLRDWPAAVMALYQDPVNMAAHHGPRRPKPHRGIGRLVIGWTL